MEEYLNKIHCADCLEFIKEMPDNSVDLVLTDPPYLVSQNRVFTRKNVKQVSLVFEWDDRFKDEKEYLKEMFTVIKECSRLLKSTGSIYVFIADRYNSFIRKFMIDCGLHYKNTLVWYKTNPVPHFMKNNFCNSYEFCCFACKNPKEFIFHFGWQKNMHNVISLPICGGHERTSHPSQKPLKLVKNLIEISSEKDAIVLDPYLGSGTTAVACKELNRNYIGIEINPDYCKIAERRLNNTEKPLF